MRAIQFVVLCLLWTGLESLVLGNERLTGLTKAGMDLTGVNITPEFLSQNISTDEFATRLLSTLRFMDSPWIRPYMVNLDPDGLRMLHSRILSGRGIPGRYTGQRGWILPPVEPQVELQKAIQLVFGFNSLPERGFMRMRFRISKLTQGNVPTSKLEIRLTSGVRQYPISGTQEHPEWVEIGFFIEDQRVEKFHPHGDTDPKAYDALRVVLINRLDNPWPDQDRKNFDELLRNADGTSPLPWLLFDWLEVDAQYQEEWASPSEKIRWTQDPKGAHRFIDTFLEHAHGTRPDRIALEKIVKAYEATRAAKADVDVALRKVLQPAVSVLLERSASTAK